MENKEKENTSAYNEASLKMGRLDKLQDWCNSLRRGPYRITKLGNYFFKDHYRTLISLYQEVSSKLKDHEIEKIKPMLKELKEKVNLLSLKMTREEYTGLTPSAKEFCDSVEGIKLQDEVEEGLFDCEELIRKYLDEHGFSTLTVEDNHGDYS